MKTNDNKKRGFFLTRWFKRMFFGSQKELSFMEEEALQSPLRSVISNFRSKKLSMFGLITFVIILLFVLIGPIFLPIDLSHQDNTQINVAPGLNMMKVPEQMQKNGIRKIVPSTTFSLGLDESGQVYIWGYTRVTQTIDLKNIPEEVRTTKIVDIAAGYDHAVALAEDGQFYFWGNTRLGQNRLPNDLQNIIRKGENPNIVQIVAGNQFTAALNADGKLYLWGNDNLNDIKVKKAYADIKVKKVTANATNYLVLTEDGAAAYTGMKDSALAKVPAGLDSGIVDIASTSATNAALKEDGTVVVWGNMSNGENRIPEHEGKIIKIYGGRNHYTALTDQNDLISWGSNAHGEGTAPEAFGSDRVATIFTGFYQNYAITQSGKLYSWGLSGYLLGTDHLGRDVLVRIVNGGRVTMTVGAVAVIISSIIGILLGGLAGYFGGSVDMILSRFAELISSLPFLPFALILSAIIGTRISVEQRMYLIMVVLGILSWPGLFRLVRAQMFTQREMEYVNAAKILGIKEGNIVFKHIIPNIVSVILVSMTLSFASSMLTEASLSYLGFGISPPTPTWGNMLTGANDSIVIQQYWWRWLFTAIIFSICTICINLIGDGLRDAIDPKSNDR